MCGFRLSLGGWSCFGSENSFIRSELKGERGGGATWASRLCVVAVLTLRIHGIISLRERTDCKSLSEEYGYWSFECTRCSCSLLLLSAAAKEPEGARLSTAHFQ